MKITSVEIIRSFKEPSIPAEVAVGNVPWHPVFVRINTDEGISGSARWVSRMATHSVPVLAWRSISPSAFSVSIP